jgi:hypothetical protein
LKRSSAEHNIESLILVAHRLGDLCDEVIFVGGSVIGLLITDTAGPDVRFTVDVDCIVNVITKPHYYKLAEKLRKKGFKEMILGNHPICRWDCDGILVDIMPTDESVLGFSNRWYKDAIKNAISKKISSSISIKIISSPYFLATKLEAFKDRGEDDYLLSHDFEDMISLIDGREEIIADLSEVSDNFKQFLSTEFAWLKNNSYFMDALPGHLNYSSELENRKEIVLSRIQSIIDMGNSNELK